MPKRPPGLKLYPQQLTGSDLDTLRERCRALPPPPANPLFRYFGDFGENIQTEDVRPWMLETATSSAARRAGSGSTG